MEVPVCLAIDTTENWNRSSTVLGIGELAIEVHTFPDGTKVDYLLKSDGKPVGPNVERLRVKANFIAELPGILDDLFLGGQQLQENLNQVERKLQTNISQAERRLRQSMESFIDEVAHDDTLTGKGLKSDPLSVKIKYDLTVAGLVASAEIAANGKDKIFPLPADFVFIRILLVAINGLGQRAGSDYALDLDARTINFIETPEDGDVITLAYTAAE